MSVKRKTDKYSEHVNDQSTQMAFYRNFPILYEYTKEILCRVFSTFLPDKFPFIRP